MGKFQRVFVIVLDSLGFGAMPDAEQYGDSNVDTIGHIAEKMQLHIPNLQKLGAANIRPINGVASVTAGSTGRETTGILFFPERSKYRKGYDDRTLGDDGTIYYQAI